MISPFSLEKLWSVNKYKEKLANFQGKDLGSIRILNKDEAMKDKERGQAIKDMIKEEPPSQPYIENIPYIIFK